MFCNKCGKMIKNGNRFCEGCGAPAAAASMTNQIATPVSTSNTVSQPAAAAMVPAGAVSTEMGLFLNGKTIRKTYPNSLWQKGCPIRITECVIADKDLEGNIALSIQIENLSKNIIEGIFFDVKGFDILKAEKCNLENIACIDLRILPNQKAILPTSIDLADKLIRKVSIIVRHVVFDDETIWDYEGSEALAAVTYEQKQVLVDHLADLDSLAKEVTENGYGMEKYPYYAVNGDGFFVCACGQFNAGEVCTACNEKKDVIVKNFTSEVIAKRKQLRIEKEEKEAAERKAREEAERKAAEERARIAAEEARRAEEERQRIAAEEAKKAEEERIRQEEMARIRAQEEAKKAQDEAKKAQEETKDKAEAEAKKAETEEKAKAEAEAKANAEREALIKKQQEAVARIKNAPVSNRKIDEIDEVVKEEPVKMEVKPQNAFCTNCGTKLIPGNAFCTGCGIKI